MQPRTIALQVKPVYETCRSLGPTGSLGTKAMMKLPPDAMQAPTATTARARPGLAAHDPGHAGPALPVWIEQNLKPTHALGIQATPAPLMGADQSLGRRMPPDPDAGVRMHTVRDATGTDTGRSRLMHAASTFYILTRNALYVFAEPRRSVST